MLLSSLFILTSYPRFFTLQGPVSWNSISTCGIRHHCVCLRLWSGSDLDRDSPGCKAGPGHIPGKNLLDTLDTFASCLWPVVLTLSSNISPQHILQHILQHIPRPVPHINSPRLHTLTPPILSVQRVATELLYQHQGYAVELADGLILASFSDPANAIIWALDLVEAMPDQV